MHRKAIISNAERARAEPSPSSQWRWTTSRKKGARRSQDDDARWFAYRGANADIAGMILQAHLEQAGVGASLGHDLPGNLPVPPHQREGEAAGHHPMLWRSSRQRGLGRVVARTVERIVESRAYGSRSWHR